MASKIRIHRSTGAAAPSSLEFGELAATVEQGTAGASGNKAGRLFIGNVAGNPVEIGGEYIYKLLDHTPGQTHPVSALITDSNGNIDGIKIAGISTITRTDITDAVTQNLRVTGITTFVQGVILNGNTTIGNSHTDTLTINARTGVSTDLTFNNGFKVAGISTFNGTVDVNAASTFGANVTFETNNGNNVQFNKGSNFFKFGDNVKAKWGTGGDLEISHNGSDSTIDNNTGDLYIKTTGSGDDIQIDSADDFLLNTNSKKSIQAIGDGAVELYHNDAKKVETSASGATVTGTLNVVDTITTTNVTATHNTLTHTVGTGATFTGSFHLGSGGTNYRFPVARGANDQILISDANGQLAFEDVPGTLVISAGYASTDAVQLLPDVLTIAATTDETKTTLTNNKITVGLATDVKVGGGLTVTNNCHIIGNLTVDGTETVLNTIRLDVQDNKVGVGSTSTASNTTANGCGYFVHGGSDGDKEILYLHNKLAFTTNQNWLPVSDDSKDLGGNGQEWKDLWIDGIAYIDTLNVHVGATYSAGADLTLTGSTSGENIVWDSSEGTLDIKDDVKLMIGDGDDMSLYHDGSNSYLETANTGGHLYIKAGNNIYIQTDGGNQTAIQINEDTSVDLAYNGNTKFQTTATGTNVTGVHVDDGATHDGDVTFTGASSNVVWDKSDNFLEFADNSKATFGSGDDLQIWHSGSGSHIRNTEGDLIIDDTNGSIKIRAKSNEDSIVCSPDAGVDLYHNHVKKLDTEAYGVEVTGTLGSDTLIVTGVSTVASLIFSAGTNTNGVSYFDANGQVQSTVAPASGISTSNYILTTNASGVPTWTSTIDCGTF